MGMPFFRLYNYGAAILRAVGDTKRPLYFLIVSGVINAGLNMFLVIVFSLGVAGVAIATVVSQAISCVLVLRCLYKSEGSYQLRFSKLCLKKDYIIPIFQVGIPAGIQSTVINFSERAAAVIRQFLRFDCNGRLHGGQQCAGIFIHLSQLRHPGVHELHKPELRCRKIQTNG